MKTTQVRWQGQTVRAYADERGVVRVWDAVAGHYTVCHSLTAGQERHVRRLTQPRAEAQS